MAMEPPSPPEGFVFLGDQPLHVSDDLVLAPGTQDYIADWIEENIPLHEVPTYFLRPRPRRALNVQALLHSEYAIALGLHRPPGFDMASTTNDPRVLSTGTNLTGLAQYETALRAESWIPVIAGLYPPAYDPIHGTFLLFGGEVGGVEEFGPSLEDLVRNGFPVFVRPQQDFLLRTKGNTRLVNFETLTHSQYGVELELRPLPEGFRMVDQRGAPLTLTIDGREVTLSGLEQHKIARRAEQRIPPQKRSPFLIRMPFRDDAVHRAIHWEALAQSPYGFKVGLRPLPEGFTFINQRDSSRSFSTGVTLSGQVQYLMARKIYKIIPEEERDQYLLKFPGRKGEGYAIHWEALTDSPYGVELGLRSLPDYFTPLNLGGGDITLSTGVTLSAPQQFSLARRLGRSLSTSERLHYLAKVPRRRGPPQYAMDWEALAHSPYGIRYGLRPLPENYRLAHWEGDPITLSTGMTLSGAQQSRIARAAEELIPLPERHHFVLQAPSQNRVTSRAVDWEALASSPYAFELRLRPLPEGFRMANEKGPPLTLSSGVHLEGWEQYRLARQAEGLIPESELPQYLLTIPYHRKSVQRALHWEALVQSPYGPLLGLREKRADEPEVAVKTPAFLPPPAEEPHERPVIVKAYERAQPPGTRTQVFSNQAFIREVGEIAQASLPSHPRLALASRHQAGFLLQTLRSMEGTRHFERMILLNPILHPYQTRGQADLPPFMMGVSAQELVHPKNMGPFVQLAFLIEHAHADTVLRLLPHASIEQDRSLVDDILAFVRGEPSDPSRGMEVYDPDRPVALEAPPVIKSFGAIDRFAQRHLDRLRRVRDVRTARAERLIRDARAVRRERHQAGKKLT
ncbi:MAG: hypothetical protein A2053_03470 [Deltaproteobacteria bacterium GWA2_50_8]|nr:MAG: hypothetical protein A2053_03470 [Deltaproteobacteria bacterium GWA2_50_8]OGQ28540.1 MAG: hypothetical protein A3B79_01840 [Deltaproteobacteria bacterium RIFCSPHIGHO2_02_FULL_50_15]